MSHPDTTAREMARQLRSITKATGAKMASRTRGPDRRVRRNSYDVDDPRAKVWRPINGGKKAAGLRWRDALIRTAKEYQLLGKQPGRQGPFGPSGLRVLEELLALVDFATGRLDPTYRHLMARTGFAKVTIANALRRLRTHKFLDWMRRTRIVDTAEGPARQQTSNAFYFSPGSLPKRVFQRFRDLLARAELRAQPPATAASPEVAAQGAPLIRDPELAAAIARLGALIDKGAE